jgi:hypothetical protein
MTRRVLLTIVLLCSVWTDFSASSAQRGAAPALPRTADGKPNLQGIWQVKNKAAADLLGERGVVEGGEIPYRPEAAAKRRENFNTRKTADPLNSCYLPGTPRIMYLEYPYHIFQTPEHVAITFEWSQVHRVIYVNGTKNQGIESWMGDSRGRWEGDTLVVDVRDHNNKTWFDAAGNFHSDKLTLVERYTLQNADTIQYEVTITDPDVYTRPWTIRMPLHRQTGKTRILEFQCQAEKEEAEGLFERDPRTWYPSPNTGAPARGGAR